MNLQENTEFYCDKCDHNLVNSDKPETGKFFHKNGHILLEDGKTGNWETVVWAVCAECLSES